MANKVWTKEEIRNLLETNNIMVEKSVVKIYELQTADEQVLKETNHCNGVGFNGTDSRILSSLAEWVMSGKHLSQKQMAIARKKIMKYAGQLTLVANNTLKKDN